MSLNQYAVYQLKPDDSTRPFRFKSYSYVLDNHIAVVSDNYRQVYIAGMARETEPAKIREQLEHKLPLKFSGRALNVSDVIVVTRDGITTAYYVDIKGLVSILGFFRFNSSTALITMNTSGVLLEGRRGSWMATDEMIIDGKQFFLMACETIGHNTAALAVVDNQGHKAAEDTLNGFDEITIQQIRKHLKPEEPAIDNTRLPDGKPRLDNWQKYHENGEYLRSVESGTEQNYNMIDGISNNKKAKTDVKTQQDNASAEEKPAEKKALPAVKQEEPKKRISVLKRLREKQDLVAERYGRKAPEHEKDDMERNRK